MPSTDLHHLHHRTTDRPAARGRRRTRLAGAVVAAALACTLAACGSSEPEPLDGLAAAAAAEVDIPAVLEAAAASMSAGEVPSQEEARKVYEEWLDRKAGVGDPAPLPDRPLAVGDCTDHLPMGAEDDAAKIASVDCGGEHLTEVYGAVSLAELGSAYPRFADLAAAAREGCEAGFPQYVGRNGLEARLTFDYVVPSEHSWQNGDTTVLCYAYPLSGAPFTGTLQGSNP
jgi:hypothetical protein